MWDQSIRKAVNHRKTNALIQRDSDAMRIGTPASLDDVQATLVTVFMADPVAINERVKLELCNDIQRFNKLTHGRVSMIAEFGREYRVAFTLASRLNPHEVLTLRMQLARYSW